MYFEAVNVFETIHEGGSATLCLRWLPRNPLPTPSVVSDLTCPISANYFGQKQMRLLKN